MKFITTISLIGSVFLLAGCVTSAGFPKVVSFWVEYGPEKIKPTSYRCSIQIIDLDQREEGKVKKGLVKLSVFRNGDDKKLTSFERKVLLPSRVMTSAIWSNGNVTVEIKSRDGKTKYFSESLAY